MTIDSLRFSIFVPVFILFHTSLVYSQTSQGYTAHYAKKYGAKFGIFTSKNVNKIPPELSANELKGKTPEQLQAHYEVVNFNFKCPGYSFINEVESHYKNNSTDEGERLFRFGCAFLENDSDELLKKVECKNDLMPTDNKNKQNGISTCQSDEFIHGIESRRFNDGKLTADRQYKSFCCKIKDWKEQVLKPQGECETFSYPAGKSFTMTCPKDMILKSITSVYHSNTKDRAYNFSCCHAGI